MQDASSHSNSEKLGTQSTYIKDSLRLAGHPCRNFCCLAKWKHVVNAMACGKGDKLRCSVSAWVAITQRFDWDRL